MLLLSGFSSWCWFLIVLSLLFKKILLWLNPVNTWTACRHQGHQDVAWHGVRKCLSCVGRCAELQQDSQPWGFLPAPLRQLRTSPWALGSLDLALGRPACPAEPRAHVSLCWPCGSPPAAGRRVHPRSVKGAEAVCLAGLRALHQPHLESGAGRAATPSEWRTRC